MAYPALMPHTKDCSKGFRLLPSIKRSISASSFESLFDSTLLIIRLSFIHASSFISWLKSMHSVNSSLLRSERTSSVKILMHSGLYWPGHKRKMLDMAKSSCTDDSIKNKRPVDIRWTACWNFVNNSATFTRLKIHEINGAGFSTSSIVVAVATIVYAALVSTVDSISVVFVVSFAVEMVVAWYKVDGVKVAEVDIVASAPVEKEESALVARSAATWTYSVHSISTSSRVLFRVLSFQYNLNSSDFFKRSNSDCKRSQSSARLGLLIIEVYRLTAYCFSNKPKFSAKDFSVIASLLLTHH